METHSQYSRSQSLALRIINIESEFDSIASSCGNQIYKRIGKNILAILDEPIYKTGKEIREHIRGYAALEGLNENSELDYYTDSIIELLKDTKIIEIEERLTPKDKIINFLLIISAIVGASYIITDQLVIPALSRFSGI